MRQSSVLLAARQVFAGIWTDKQMLQADPQSRVSCMAQKRTKAAAVRGRPGGEAADEGP